MDTQLIAKILPTKKNGKRSIGTGYPISHELVLTARHVVLFDERDDNEPISIEWPDLKDHSGEPCKAKVTEIVYESEQYDIAVLQCQVPPQAHISPLILSENFPKEHQQWESFGYPEIGKNGKPETREKISALGKFHPPDTDSHKIGLTSESDVQNKERWFGISGAPVFQDKILYAVITETSKERKNYLTAVSIPYLLNRDTDFRKTVGLDRPEQIFSSAIAYLQEHPKAEKALSTQIGRVCKSLENSSPAIIRYLVKLPICELIRIVHETQRSMPSVRQDLRQLVSRLLPSLYGFDCVTQIRASKGNVSAKVLEIPYATDVSAEILMASTDMRPIDFKVIDLGNRKQMRAKNYRLPHPPESGPDDGRQQHKDRLDDLHDRLAGEEKWDAIQFQIDEYLFDRITPKQRRNNYSFEDKKILTQRALKRDAKAERPSYYWLWDIAPDTPEEDQLRVLAEALKANYPQIIFLSLDYDVQKEADEEDLFVFLADTQATD